MNDIDTFASTIINACNARKEKLVTIRELIDRLETLCRTNVVNEGDQVVHSWPANVVRVEHAEPIQYPVKGVELMSLERLDEYRKAGV